MCIYIGCVAAGPQEVYGVCNTGYIFIPSLKRSIIFWFCFKITSFVQQIWTAVVWQICKHLVLNVWSQLVWTSRSKFPNAYNL